MSGTCDVDGCGKHAIAKLLSKQNGKRCKKCLEYDLDS